VRSIKILIVEDSRVVRDRWRNLLAGLEGIEIRGLAEGPDEALHLLQGTEFDAVLLDFRLKDGDAFPVLKAAKELHPAPMVIVLSNHSQPQYRDRCLQAGADYFFDKAGEFDRALHVLERSKD
jgi:DNA-binding NarL/FixJ family response regulator